MKVDSVRDIVKSEQCGVDTGEDVVMAFDRQVLQFPLLSHQMLQNGGKILTGMLIQQCVSV